MSSSDREERALGDRSGRETQASHSEDLHEKVKELTHTVLELQKQMKLQAELMEKQLQEFKNLLTVKTEPVIKEIEGEKESTKEGDDEDRESNSSGMVSNEESENEKPDRFVVTRRKKPKVVPPRKSILKAGTSQIEVESDPEEGKKIYNFKANNSKHPKVPEAKAIDPPALIKLEKEYLEYQRRCRSAGLAPCSIVDCFSVEATEMLKWGDNKSDERDITEEYIWQRIDEAKKKHSTDRSGLILRDLPGELEGKFDLKLADVRSRMESLWTALRRYLKESGSEYFLDESKDGDPDENKFRRATIVEHLANAIRPNRLRQTIRRQLEEHPSYKFSPRNFYDLVIREGEAFEHIFRQTKANQESKSVLFKRERAMSESSRKSHKSAGVKVKAKSVKTVLNAGATCSFCKQKGHHFLRLDKETASYVKNCPEKCDGKIFPQLRKEEVERIEALKSKRKNRMRSPDKTTARQAEPEVAGATQVDAKIMQQIVDAFTVSLTKAIKGETGQNQPAGGEGNAWQLPP